MNEALISQVKSEVAALLPEIIEIRRHLHRHPELSQKEFETKEFIKKNLQKANIDYYENPIDNSIIGIIRGKDNQFAVGIRGDIDALPITEEVHNEFVSENPGVMHACGHDIHTAVLLGTGMVLNKIKDQLPGSVKLFFQAAEETVGGADALIQNGCLENPFTPATIGLHVDPEYDAGEVVFMPKVVNATSTEFEVVIKGKACHGAHPQNGIDALSTACRVILSLQEIVTKHTLQTVPSLITVGKIVSGTKNNILPGEAKFSGIIRSFDMQAKEDIKKRIETQCNGICQAFGCSAEVTYYDSYPVLKNDDLLLDLASKAVNDFFTPDEILIQEKPSLGCDDFAYFCQHSKGLYYNIGCHKKGDENRSSLHDSCFDPDESCIETGIISEIAIVYKLLSTLKEEENAFN